MATLFVYIIAIILSNVNSQTIFSATTSNSTHQSFLSDSNNLFQNGEITCTSSQLCHVECTNANACENTIINCGSAAECMISCNADYACKSATFSSNSYSTSLYCNGREACRFLTISSVHSPIFDWNCGTGSWVCQNINSQLQPLSIVSDNFTWTCGSGAWACDDVHDLNISANIIKITCSGSWGCSDWQRVSMVTSNYVFLNCQSDESCSHWSNIEYPQIFETLCFGIDSCTGLPREQDVPNPMNDTIDGQYWTAINTNMNSLFVDAIMNCTNSKLCQFNCFGSRYTCRNALFYCNDAEQCIINCGTVQGYGYACQGSTIYTPNNNTATTLTCIGDYSCESVTISDRDHERDNFNIFCIDTFGGCDITLPIPYPLIQPSIVNASGEYYFNMGSFININCTHDILCDINCNAGSCTQSSINCDNVNECNILCDGSGDYACKYMKITANYVDMFSFECYSSGTWSCKSSVHNLYNINEVDINCGLGRPGGFACQGSTFNIMSNDFNLECVGSFPCYNTQFNIENVKNSTIHCGSSYGCHSGSRFQINNRNSYSFLCEGYACDSLIISSTTDDNNTETGYLDIDCAGSPSCDSLNVCVPKTMLDLECCGNNACADAVLCAKMDNINTTDNININCLCGTDACTGFDYYMTTVTPTTTTPTTDTPTVTPTTATPTVTPTTATPTTLTVTPTTATPTTATPTTFNPTTSSPTTSIPTTFNPTTSSPTTSIPTTFTPTTSVPTTFTPTTSIPTTATPTTPTVTPTTGTPTTSTATTIVADTSTWTLDGGSVDDSIAYAKTCVVSFVIVSAMYAVFM